MSEREPGAKPSMFKRVKAAVFHGNFHYAAEAKAVAEHDAIMKTIRETREAEQQSQETAVETPKEVSMSPEDEAALAEARETIEKS